MSTPILSKKAVVVNFSFSQTSSFFRQKTEGELPSVKMVVETDQALDKQHVDGIHRSQQIAYVENNVDAGIHGGSHTSYVTDEYAAQSLFAFDVVYNILLGERLAASYLDDNAYFIPLSY
ncbi:RHS repeat-associated core domain protein [Anoxybacillus flavithermus NBRC 109594]|uniref:RHS repeat-associated core domain protein n=1 Tax=Anoxybacillus flavithermus NBRC 109594 TaxID=1315967 RepID=R4F9B2_9BACL|nr:RHS repeat-associated core domain protein [Anoxybacillus flavithermus NBRC 109594]